MESSVYAELVMDCSCRYDRGVRSVMVVAVVSLSSGAGCNIVTGLDDFGVVDPAPPSHHAGGSGGSNGGGGSVGMGGAGGDPSIPIACAEVAASGVHTIDPDGEGGNAPFDAYCEIDLAGGGWTLVGRSVNGGIDLMGWRVDRGSVTDTGNPYSLDVVRAKLDVDALLLVVREDPPQAYTIDLPAGFVADYATSAWEAIGNITYVDGACMPAGGAPTMLRWVGYTDRTEAFFFRDIPGSETMFGLFADGIGLNYPTCDQGGGLDDKQGELYVR